MIFAPVSQIHFNLLYLGACLAYSVLNVKTLVGAFSVIVKT